MSVWSFAGTWVGKMLFIEVSKTVILRKLAIIVSCTVHLICTVTFASVDPIIRAYRDGTDWMHGNVVYLHIHHSHPQVHWSWGKVGVT